MSERDVQRESWKIFFFMLLIFSFIGAYFKSIAFPVGVCIGFAVISINFLLTIKFTDMILSTGHNITFVFVMFIGKTLLLILGLMLSVWFQNCVSIWGVFGGYMILPLTIHYVNYLYRKEEVE